MRRITVGRLPRTLAVSLALLAISCAPPARSTLPHGAPGALPSHVRVQVAPQGPVRALPLEEYVAGVLAAESGVRPRDGTAGDRMLDVQAIAARSYAVAHLSRHSPDGFDLCSTTHCQVFDERRLRQAATADAVRAAVRRTAGRVLWHGARPASAVFHADCGGHTSAARDIWGGETHPYLVAAQDDGPARSVHRTWQFAVHPDELHRALDRATQARLGPRLFGISVAARDRAGRALRVRLHGRVAVELGGEEFRTAVNRGLGSRTMLSTRFEVRRSGATLRFEGRGHGHGVGLCQAGALARLRAGSSVEAVLARYYPGTRVGSAP